MWYGISALSVMVNGWFGFLDEVGIVKNHAEEEVRWLRYGREVVELLS